MKYLVFVCLSWFALFQTEAYSKTLTELDLVRVSSQVDARLTQFQEFREVLEFARSRGVRVYLFGGSAASVLYPFLKVDLESEKPSPTDQQTDLHDFFSFVQDYDFVVDGSRAQAEQLSNLLFRKFPYRVQHYKKKWDVTSLQEIIGNPDFLNQNTDSLSALLFELTPNENLGKRFLFFKNTELFGINNPALQDLSSGKITFLRSSRHQETKFFRDSKNPEIISALRLLTKMTNYGGDLSADDERQLSEIIENRSDYVGIPSPGYTPYAPGRAHNLLVQYFFSADSLPRAFQIFMKYRLYRLSHWSVQEGQLRQISDSQKIENLIPVIASLGEIESLHPRHYRRSTIGELSVLPRGTIVEGTLFQDGDQPPLFLMSEIQPGQKRDQLPGFYVSMGEYQSTWTSGDWSVSGAPLGFDPKKKAWIPIQGDLEKKSEARLQIAAEIIRGLDLEGWVAFRKYRLDRYFFEWPHQVSHIQTSALKKILQIEYDRATVPEIREEVLGWLNQYAAGGNEGSHSGLCRKTLGSPS